MGSRFAGWDPSALGLGTALAFGAGVRRKNTVYSTLRSPVPTLSRLGHRSCREHAGARRQDGAAQVQAGQARPDIPFRG